MNELKTKGYDVANVTNAHTRLRMHFVDIIKKEFNEFNIELVKKRFIPQSLHVSSMVIQKLFSERSWRMS